MGDRDWDFNGVLIALVGDTLAESETGSFRHGPLMEFRLGGGWSEAGSKIGCDETIHAYTSLIGLKQYTSLVEI